jgi:hypothetical protein
MATAALGLDAPESEPSPSSVQRRRSKLPVIVLALVLLLSCLIASYVTRLPPQLYGYLHARGWDKTIDRTVQRVSVPVATALRKLLKR